MAKIQAFPLAFRISSRPPKKPQFLLGGYQLSLQSSLKTHKQFHSLGPRNISVDSRFETSRRNALWSYSLVRNNLSFSNSYSEMASRGSGKTLPWLTTAKAKKIEKNVTMKTSRSSWEESAQKFLKAGPSSTVEFRETRNFDDRQNERKNSDQSVEETDEADDVNDDPRWDNIQNKFNKILVKKRGSDKPEVKRWNRQENWGKKTWKEATESTLPKIVGEGIYGVGPVFAALSSRRREFYALYIQQGLDLSTNNRKKKDKKGFEKVVKMAEKIGLSIKEVSKHDLNMIVDNRPHQGLVLDGSPLQMVNMKELEPVCVEGEKGPHPLWVALDEVTDPQNLGAIIRSAYFFGASGVVLCAKNSAPLSGVVSKASAGSLELMELRSCKNMMQFLTSSAENGWRVLGGSVSSRAVSLNEVNSGVPTILVLGSEGSGLRPLVERSCTQLIRITGNLPVDLIAGGDEDEDVDRVQDSDQEFRSFLAVESLNVSVAAGVLLHHLTGKSDSVGQLLP